MEEAPVVPVVRISAVFAVRNAADPMRRSLASLEESLERPALEIFVVDNGSTDGTGQLDAEFPSVNVLRLPKNFGRTKAVNIGLRSAKGEYVLLAEPGAELPREALSTLMGRLDADAEAAAVCPYVPEAFALPNPDQLLAEWSAKAPLHGIAVPSTEVEASAEYVRNAPILVRRSFLAGMRYFDERFGDWGQDLDLARQIRNAGKKIVILPQVRATLAEHQPTEGQAMDSVDQLNGIAVYAGKLAGGSASALLRVRGALSALGRFKLSQVIGIAAGRKVDGDQ